MTQILQAVGLFVIGVVAIHCAALTYLLLRMDHEQYRYFMRTGYIPNRY